MSFDNSSSKIFERHENASFALLTYANEKRNKDMFDDVIIKTNDGQRISANRMVLSCYSKYFEKIFTTKMKEHNQREVEVKGVAGEPLKLLINYIYTGQISINQHNVALLLSGADYLHLDEIRNFCVDFLSSAITDENCLEIFEMADTYGSNMLKTKVFEHVSWNFAEVTTRQFCNCLSKDDFVLWIHFFKQDNIDHKLLCEFIFDWIKHGKENRKSELFSLLQLINFKKISIDKLESVVSEDLMYESKICAKLINSLMLKMVQDRIQFEMDSTIVSVGGGWSGKRVAEIYRLFLSHQREITYPDLPSAIQSSCSLKVNTHVYCIGGYNWKNVVNHVRRLDVSDSDDDMKWDEVAPMTSRRFSFGAAQFNEFLVVSGGSSGNGKQLASTEAYAIDANKWTTKACLKQKREANKLVVCRDNLYSLGGFNGKEYLASVEKLNGLDSEWHDVAPMQTKRCYFAAVSCEGFIYAIGGMQNNSCGMKTVEKYNPIFNTWTYVSSMNIAKYNHSACVLGGKIFVVGGCNNESGALKEIECYTPWLDEWFVVSKTEELLHNHSLIVL